MYNDNVCSGVLALIAATSLLRGGKLIQCIAVYAPALC